MTKYGLYNPCMPNTHFKSSVVWGGGGGSEKAPTKSAAQIAQEKAEAARKKAAEAAAAKARKKAEAEAKKKFEEGKKKQAEFNKKTSALQNKAITDPSSLVTKTKVDKANANAAGTNIATGTGQINTPAPQVTSPDAFSASQVNPSLVAGQVQQETSNLQATQGTVSQDALAQAQQGDAANMTQNTLDPAQIAASQTVAPIPPRIIEPGELISGSPVDMARVTAATEVQTAQADPEAKATVQGQLEDLMEDFQGSTPPPWAAGALRNATSQMAARGLGASSMAGQALVQAAMESALPIAMQDAQTNAQFELTNLSNRQQSAMFAAEQRSNFLGMEFTQEFQTRVANASKISDIANMNFTAEQQVALENARMAQTVDIANLDARQAKIMADAAAMTQMDLANLNNRQQSAVQNAQAFLAMDMSNADREQQTRMFKAQKNIDALFSDQAADNAAKQFNAASENQTNQFFANMKTQVDQFNAGMTVQRDQFNAQNSLVVAQANAQWRQNVETMNTAAQNDANRQDAMAANQFTQSTLDQIWQRERDIMDYSFRQSESAQDRAMSVFLADKQEDFGKWQQGQANKNARREGLGYVAGRLLFG